MYSTLYLKRRPHTSSGIIRAVSETNLFDIRLSGRVSTANYFIRKRNEYMSQKSPILESRISSRFSFPLTLKEFELTHYMKNRPKSQPKRNRSKCGSAKLTIRPTSKSATVRDSSQRTHCSLLPSPIVEVIASDEPISIHPTEDDLPPLPNPIPLNGSTTPNSSAITLQDLPFTPSEQSLPPHHPICLCHIRTLISFF